MPIYEFKCIKCEKTKEELLSFSDKKPEKCECGGKLEQVISRTSFQLNGTGWYSTDYKGK